MVFEHSAPRALSALGRSIFSSCRAATPSLARPAFVTTPTTPKSSSFSTTPARRANDGNGYDDQSSANVLASALPMNQRPTSNYGSFGSGSSSYTDMLYGRGGIDYKAGEARLTEEPVPYHLHILSHKHNTILTLSRPNRDSIMTFSCGNLGFKNSARGSFDAAYQLTAYMLKQIQERGLLLDIKHLELVFRGFGEGREAARKAIMGAEGINIRNRIVRVTDATRLKFGGTRSPKPRRLG